MENELITKKSILTVLKSYWYQYKKYPLQSIVAFSAPAIGSILVFFVPPLILGKIIDIFSASGNISFGSVGSLVALLGGLWMLGEILWRIGFNYLIILETKGINNLSKNAYDLLAGRDYDFYTNHFVGSLTKKALAFSRSFETFTDTLLFNVFSNLAPVIFVIIILWRYSPWIPLLLVSCLTLAISIALPIMRRRSKLVAERHDASSKMVGRLSDSITNISAVKSFAKEKQEYAVYGEYVDTFTEKFKKAADYHNRRFDVTIAPLYVITNVLGLIAAIFFAQKLGLHAGAIVIVFSYYSQVSRIFWEINRTYRNIESSISEAAEFTQMFIASPAIGDVKNALKLDVSAAHISFNEVTFKYDKNQEDENSFLNAFNLDIKSNQKVGLVGPSGGGKTTITKLLLRFIPYTPVLCTGQNAKLTCVWNTSERGTTSRSSFTT